MFSVSDAGHEDPRRTRSRGVFRDCSPCAVLCPLARSLLPYGVVLALLLPAHLPAQGVRSLALSAENDGLVFWTPPSRRTDWYYTSGIRADVTLAWASPFARFLGQTEPVVCASSGSQDRCILTRITVGQAIYTPASLFSQDPDPGDRPYAGWLFVRTTSGRVEGHTFRSLGLEFGVTGGPSLAGPLHRWFHRYLGKYEPQGWDHQLPFELAFALQYEAREAIPLMESPNGFSVHLEPRGSVTLGTLRTATAAGGEVILGWNAPPALRWLGASAGLTHVQLAMGADAEVVLRDLFLDGSTWRQSDHADKVPLLGELTARIQLGWRAVGVEFAATRTSAQFKGQQGPHTVGTVRFMIHP